MNKELREILEDLKTVENGDYTLMEYERKHILTYINQLQKKAELAEHYKHLYSKVKKQKDDVVEYVKHYINFRKDIYPYIDMREFDLDKLLRMLGETDD